jgi:hypothetical protein
LSAIVQRLDPTTARRLTRCREALNETLRRVNDLNAENAAIMAHSMKWIGGAMRLLDHLFNPKTVYRRSGRFAQGGHTGRVLNGTY